MRRIIMPGPIDNGFLWLWMMSLHGKGNWNLVRLNICVWMRLSVYHHHRQHRHHELHNVFVWYVSSSLLMHAYMHSVFADRLLSDQCLSSHLSFASAEIIIIYSLYIDSTRHSEQLGMESTLVCKSSGTIRKKFEPWRCSPRSRLCHRSGSSLGSVQRKSMAVSDWNLARTTTRNRAQQRTPWTTPASTTTTSKRRCVPGAFDGIHVGGIRGPGQCAAECADQGPPRSRYLCEHGKRTDRLARNDWYPWVVANRHCAGGGVGNDTRCGADEILVARGEAIAEKRTTEKCVRRKPMIDAWQKIARAAALKSDQVRSGQVWSDHTNNRKTLTCHYTKQEESAIKKSGYYNYILLLFILLVVYSIVNSQSCRLLRMYRLGMELDSRPYADVARICCCGGSCINVDAAAGSNDLCFCVVSSIWSGGHSYSTASFDDLK